MSSKNFTGRPSPMFVCIILLVCLASAAAVFWMIQDMVIPPQGIPETTPPAAVTTVPAPITTETTAPPETTEPAVTTEPSPDTTEIPPEIAAPLETTAPPPPVITLPAAETPVGEDYFTSILFIGDSRTQGLQIATGGYGATFYADRGLSIEGVSAKQFIVRKEGTLSVIEALRAEPWRQNIYIWLGLNELGWNSPTRFENVYRDQLTAIRAVCPDANIVIMSVLPVGRNAVVVGVNSSAESNRRVAEHNAALLRLAEEFGVYYLNCYEAFADAEGYMPNEYASDGIHLLRDRNLELCNYILSHPVPQN